MLIQLRFEIGLKQLAPWI